MKLHPQIRRSPRSNEDGYVLLTLLLVVALAGIVYLFGVAPSIKFSMQREREEEMIHRGTQYSRAIRAYYKKFGRYPSKVEDLENTNQVRFLRKRYQDPFRCKAGKCEDFKIVHFGEVQLAGSVAMGMATGGNPLANNPGGPNGNSTFGNSNSSFGQNSTFGQNSFGQNGQSNPNGINTSQNPQGTPNDSGADPNSANGNGNPGDIASPQDQSSGKQQEGQQFGGAAMIGVASLSKLTTIREYNHKKKYNEWLFVFDPSIDRGGLITTPYQPMQAAFGMGGAPPNLNQQLNGTSGGSSFGQPPTGMQNNPNLPSSGTFGNSPSSPPQQSPQQQ
jgi:type II secretory pathway pseudopilin PulG